MQDAFLSTRPNDVDQHGRAIDYVYCARREDIEEDTDTFRDSIQAAEALLLPVDGTQLALYCVLWLSLAELRPAEVPLWTYQTTRRAAPARILVRLVARKPSPSD